MVIDKEEKNKNLPWVEKYRPKSLDDLISHEQIISTINRFINEGHLPHLLFYGPPGTGKTSTILACARKLYSSKEFNSMVLELNASDDRGIGVVREQILSFASTRTIFSSGFKLVILDEADAMTNDAQNALRRVIEKFTENVRFCLICNYLSKIIPAIQSRCTRFRFGPLSQQQILPRLQYVIEEENLNVTEDGVKSLLTLSEGDMRKVINILQSTSMAFDVVNEDNVYNCVGHPLRSDIKNILNWMLNENIATSFKNISKLKTLKGLALQDVITEIHTLVHRIDFPMSVRIDLVIELAEIEHRLLAGSSEKLQLSGLIAAFSKAQRNVVKMAEEES
ncbi:Replication factor C subunit 5 [Armadillidium nasatum]|uniref:Activator 1 subunit 5 n=1 Tax=Armadillidium nasatum TaxID=96803 RepID=A0A5N5TLP6_9CRUS|nr:Replication factor C subunit 5 [Armadillidium nasatum]